MIRVCAGLQYGCCEWKCRNIEVVVQKTEQLAVKVMNEMSSMIWPALISEWKAYVRVSQWLPGYVTFVYLNSQRGKCFVIEVVALLQMQGEWIWVTGRSHYWQSRMMEETEFWTIHWMLLFTEGLQKMPPVMTWVVNDFQLLQQRDWQQ